MRILLLPLFFMTIVMTSCDGFKKTTKLSTIDNCKELKKVKNGLFSELSTVNYELNDLRQNGDHLEMDIITNADLTQSNLYWTGSVRKSYPPQASVKLILKEGKENSEPTSNERIKVKHSFCFDMSDMEDYGERIKIYIMDDEEVIDFMFKK
ncbi:MAG: hypothetical protein ACI94Y_000059 [Maribacter sp.]|jgi:hypothetical protein